MVIAMDKKGQVLRHMLVLVAGGLGMHSSVRTKLERQVATWRSANIRITLAGPVPVGTVLPNWILDDSLTRSYSSKLGRYLALMRVCSAILRLGVDCVYLRQGVWHPWYGRLFRKVKCFTEFNALDAVEYQSTKPTVVANYHKLTRTKWCKEAQGAIALTEEIAQSIRPFQDSVKVISNGIPETSRRAEKRRSSNDIPVLGMLVSGGYSWNGIDKLVTFARQHQDVRIEIIGGGDSLALMTLPQNVITHRYLDGSQLSNALDRFDVGVGTLALHRKGMTEACTLKVREYLAEGIPIVLGYHDTDFSAGYDYVCQVENDEFNVERNAEKLVAFAKAWKGRRIPYERTAFASFSQKEAQRLEFIRNAL